MSIIKPSKTYYLRFIKQSKTAYMKTACRQKLGEQIPCLRLKQKEGGPFADTVPLGNEGMNHRQS